RLEAIIREFGLAPQKGDRRTLEDQVDMMRGQIQVDVRGKDSFTITYENTNPETAMNITNRLASLFIEENLKVREQQAEGTTQFLDAQLQAVKVTLENQEATLRTFRQQYMGELPSQLDANLRTLDRLQLEFQATHEALSVAEDQQVLLQAAEEINPANPLQERLYVMRMELSRLEIEYTDKYPEVARLRNEIAELETQVAQEKRTLESSAAVLSRSPVQGRLSPNTIRLRTLGPEIENLRSKRTELTQQIKVLQGRVDRTPLREEQLSAIVRDYENTQNNYDSLLEKKLSAQLSENLEKRQKGEQFRILDPANLPDKPSKPVPLNILLMGLAAGLGSGIGLTLLFEQLDSSFRKAEDLHTTTGLPVLAAIPTFQGSKTK
ncbi:MAG: hypothetical protein HZA19_04865, partial [Nitrospirae bacterium]|nr:hypothetical protein [Nitrospirota bacterium]